MSTNKHIVICMSLKEKKMLDSICKKVNKTVDELVAEAVSKEITRITSNEDDDVR